MMDVFSLEYSPPWYLVSLWHLHAIWYSSLSRIQLHLFRPFRDIPTVLNMFRLVLLIHQTDYWQGICLVFHFPFTTIILFVLNISLTTIVYLRRVLLDDDGDAKKGEMVLLWLDIVIVRVLPLLLFFFEAHFVFGFQFEFIKDRRHNHGGLWVILVLRELLAVIRIRRLAIMWVLLLSFHWVFPIFVWIVLRALIRIILIFTFTKRIRVLFDNRTVTYLVVDVFWNHFFIVDFIFII